MTKPIVMFRPSLAEDGEIEAAIEVFGKDNVYTSLASFVNDRSYMAFTKVKPNVPVLARYCLIPHHKETEELISLFGDKLVNPYRTHRYIANLSDWYCDLEGLTPKTWFELSDVPKNGGPYVLKGETNSKKFQFDTHMFAKDFKAATEVYLRLSQDSMIGDQSIYIREYVELEKLADGLRGLPITKEFRFFVYNQQIIAGGYYWASHVDDLPSIPSTEEVPKEFLEKVIEKIAPDCTFYALDVAKTKDGNWIVIEINDGQQSGLSCIDPKVFYKNLHDAMCNTV